MASDTISHTLATITLPPTLPALLAQLNALTPPLAVVVALSGRALGVADTTTIAHAQALGHTQCTPALHLWPLPGRIKPVICIYGAWNVLRHDRRYVARPTQPYPHTTVAWDAITQLLDAPVIPIIQHICGVAQANQSTLYMVGGAARSVYDRQPIHDLDLALHGNVPVVAATVAAQLGGTLITHGPFGTASIDMPNATEHVGITRLDLIPTRREHYARAGALPTVVETDITADTQRRDISINAIAIELRVGADCPVYDPFDGRHDLYHRHLHLLHPLSFCDDPTRIIRVARLVERLQLQPRRTLARVVQATMAHHHLHVVSHQRWYQEITKTLQEHDPVPALARLWHWKFWKSLHPAFDVHPHHYQHLARVPLPYRLVAWLWYAPTPALLALLQTWSMLPRTLRDMPALKAQLAAINQEPGIRPSQLMHRIGEYDRAMLHAIGIGDPAVARLANHLDTIAARTPPLHINGHDIIAIGIGAGPAVKRALQALHVALYDGECTAQTRTEQMAWVHRHFGPT